MNWIESLISGIAADIAKRKGEIRFYVWWTDQEQSEKVVAFDGNCPKYIIDQFNNRRGRSGRGRLFVDDSLGTGCFEIRDELFRSSSDPIFSSCAGIVIRTCDLRFISSQPGTLTDDKLRVVWGSKFAARDFDE